MSVLADPDRAIVAAAIARARRPVAHELFEIVSVCSGGGYRYCRTKPTHPRANSAGLYPLHRVLVENRLGRLLAPGEVVHHKDGDKANDDPSNLEVMDSADHSRLHHPESELVDVECAACGRTFSLKRHVLRLRLRRNGGYVLCSRSCRLPRVAGSIPAPAPLFMGLCSYCGAPAERGAVACEGHSDLPAFDGRTAAVVTTATSNGRVGSPVRASADAATGGTS